MPERPPFLLLAAALTPLVLAACASLPRARAADWPLPDPMQAPFEGQKIQDVELRRAGRSVHFLAVLERRKDGVLMVGLSPTGTRLLRVLWTKDRVDAQVSPQAAPYLEPGAMLDELSFALWPASALREAFQGGPYRADVSAGRRVLWQGTRQRLVVERVDGPAGPAWLLRRPGTDAEIAVRDLPPDAAP